MDNDDIFVQVRDRLSGLWSVGEIFRPYTIDDRTVSWCGLNIPWGTPQFIPVAERRKNARERAEALYREERDQNGVVTISDVRLLVVPGGRFKNYVIWSNGKWVD